MKTIKIIFWSIASVFFIVVNSAAQEINDIFKREVPLTWVGIDFSGALFIGDREKYGTDEDIKILIKSWNTLMEVEYEKFNIGDAFSKSKVEKAIDITKSHNADLIVSEMVSDNSKDHDHLRPEDVQQILYSYDFGDHSGIGLMIVVESFDKLSAKASMYFTFFDLTSREIIICEKMTEKPGGFGLRNFWASTIYSSLKYLEKKEFEMWRRKYQR